jgi:hypothetical protein
MNTHTRIPEARRNVYTRKKFCKYYYCFTDAPPLSDLRLLERRSQLELCILEDVLNILSRQEEVWDESSSTDLGFDLGGMRPIRFK